MDAIAFARRSCWGWEKWLVTRYMVYVCKWHLNLEYSLTYRVWIHANVCRSFLVRPWSSRGRAGATAARRWIATASAVWSSAPSSTWSVPVLTVIPPAFMPVTPVPITSIRPLSWARARSCSSIISVPISSASKWSVVLQIWIRYMKCVIV